MPDDAGWRGPTRVTLEDVARRAAVSRSLASIVMREAPGASPATRERVLKAARELGYRPDVRARSLAGQTSRLIGVMFGVDIGVFQFDLLEGLYEAADQNGLGLILTPLTHRRDERKAAQSLDDFRFDALVMLGPQTSVPLLAGRVPVVVVGWGVDHPAVDVVRTSDDHGMAAVVSHLVGLGHRRIAHLDGGASMVAESRRAGYTAAMRAHHLTAEIDMVYGGQTQLDGQRAARVLLERDHLPTAIVSYNDDTAVAAMNVLSQHGVDIPGQLSITGWDDNEAAALSLVGLTSVAQRPDELARLAVARILDRLDRRKIVDREIVLEPELVVRSSTGNSPSRMS